MSLFPSIEKTLESNKLSREIDNNIPVPAIFHSIEWQLSTIIEKINNIDNLNENEIKNIIARQHSTFLNYDLFLSSDETRRCALKIFTNKRFLKIFLDMIGLINLSPQEIVCVNKLAYDYYTMGENKDAEVSDLLLQISYQINNVLVIRLSGILGMNGARILSMVANSSFKMEKNVHRINTFIVKCNIALSIQDIVNIYCILFQNFMYPFIYTMMETKPKDLTFDQEKRFDAISLAILSILDSMTSVDIKNILSNYAFMLKLVKVNFVPRFALKSAKSYKRILNIINEIEAEYSNDKLIIP